MSSCLHFKICRGGGRSATDLSPAPRFSHSLQHTVGRDDIDPLHHPEESGLLGETLHRTKGNEAHKPGWRVTIRLRVEPLRQMGGIQNHKNSRNRTNTNLKNKVFIWQLGAEKTARESMWLLRLLRKTGWVLALPPSRPYWDVLVPWDTIAALDTMRPCCYRELLWHSPAVATVSRLLHWFLFLCSSLKCQFPQRFFLLCRTWQSW